MAMFKSKTLFFFLTKTFLTVFILFAYPAQAKNLYEKIDRYAYATPPQAEESMEKLAAYLSQPITGFSREESTARAIYMWIVSRIQYDYYNADKITNRKKNSKYDFELFDHNVFYTRIGVCADIAHLYEKLAALAGLKAVYITGYAQAPHAWNAVSVDGKWCLLDATWDLKTNNSLKKIKNDNKYKKVVQKQIDKTPAQKKISLPTIQKRIQTAWYCVPPKEFLKTHYPDNPKWQLLTHAYSSKTLPIAYPEYRNDKMLTKYVRETNKINAFNKQQQQKAAQLLTDYNQISDTSFTQILAEAFNRNDLSFRTQIIPPESVKIIFKIVPE